MCTEIAPGTMMMFLNWEVAGRRFRLQASIRRFRDSEIRHPGTVPVYGVRGQPVGLLAEFEGIYF
jgi:hypothetical protein